MTPQLTMLAGPNGAGKSTFYDLFLSDSPLPFVNADLFAAETGIDSLQAARTLDAARDQMIEDRLGFITETVFSDPHGVKLGMLERACDAGYEVSLIYIGVASAALSGKRVDQRVARGGHDVPRDRIATRFERSQTNLKRALEFVPIVKLYDNSSLDSPFQLVATFEAGRVTYRGRIPRWARDIVPAARRKRR